MSVFPCSKVGIVQYVELAEQPFLSCIEFKQGVMVCIFDSLMSRQEIERSNVLGVETIQ